MRNFCKAFALGCPEDYPRPKTTAAKKERWLVLVFVATSAGFWFAPVRGRIWKGLYAPIVAECSEKAWNTSVIAEVPEHLRFLFQTAQPCGRPRVHELTHQRLHLRAVLSRCEARIADGEALHTEGLHALRREARCVAWATDAGTGVCKNRFARMEGRRRL